MLQIKNISKKYVTGDLEQMALDGVSLNLRDNEFVAILGPSGSGKTTLLNIIGGLDRYDTGDLIINGISTKKYKDRDWDSYRNHTVGFVFQSYNLIPHQSVLSNVELALTIGGISKADRRQRAMDALKKVGLEEHMHKRPNQLSGGQMQRVAIARALVNDPDVLLADEPTGALDSETSLQVMDLLKEVASDRLVVMVTHNPELAERYATRIVKLRDGTIRSDSDPFLLEESELLEPEHRNMGKSSMSRRTALSLSFNNLRTKKARTFLVAIAGSIGIIGIALILSLSNGVNDYIKNIEEQTLSMYPLQIDSTSFSMSNLMGLVENVEDAKAKQAEVTEMKTMTSMFTTIQKNDLKSLKEYFDSDESHMDDYVNSIEYNYGISPIIFKVNEDSVRQVNPDQSMSAMGLSYSGSNSMFTGFQSLYDIFHSLPESDHLYSVQYDVKAGHWPENYNEAVVVLTEDARVTDMTLYTLGLKDAAELDAAMKDFSEGKDAILSQDISTFDYEDFLGITFKLVNNADCFSYDSQYGVWKDKSNDKDFMNNLARNGEDITIVGIVEPKPETAIAMLQTGIAYSPDLTSHIIDKAAGSEIVKAQLASPDTNVFTGKAFDAEADETSMDLGKLFSIDENALANAFSIDGDAFSSGFDGSSMDFSNMDMSGFDLSNLDIDLSDAENPAEIAAELPGITQDAFNAALSQMDLQIAPEDLQNLYQELWNGFLAYRAENPDPVAGSFAAYVLSGASQAQIRSWVYELFNLNGAQNAFLSAVMDRLTSEDSAIGRALGSVMEKVMEQIATNIQNNISQVMTQIGESMGNAFGFDGNAFASAFQMNMSEQDLQDLMRSMFTTETSSFETNLQKMGYADMDNPNAIVIYPKDFESKEAIVDLLSDYNERMQESGDDSKTINYTDIVGALMSSVTTIINIISYVLIAFVSISLVVSSIMIGVITFISVLERRKEIGILRAIGASKKNISSVFNAETFFIGLLAGLLGVIITRLLLIPGNAIIHHLTNSVDINAFLPLGAAIVLVILSVILTMIGGLIPSKKAARSDPVEALRTE